MKKNDKNNGVSLFSQSEYLIDQDPIEEIFALNLGDFIAENLISEDLAKRIGNNIKDKKAGLKKQLKELVSIYSLQNTLCVLSFDANAQQAIYSSITVSCAENAFFAVSKPAPEDVVPTNSSSLFFSR